MGATATLNIRLPEELKEHGTQVLAKRHISVSEAVRQLFCELERSQQVPDFLADAAPRDDIQGKRKLLRTMVGASRPTPDSLEPPIAPKDHDWHEDWHEHLLEKHGGAQ